MIRFFTILVVLFFTMSSLTISQEPEKAPENTPHSSLKDSIALKIVEIQAIDTIEQLVDKKIELQESIRKQSLEKIEKKVESNQKELKKIKEKNNKLVDKVNILQDSIHKLKNDSVLVDSVCLQKKGLFKNKCKTYKYIYK